VKKYYWLLVLIIWQQSFAQTGLSFLKIGVGGRATGLAEAYSAVVDDPTATYWNPAALCRIQQIEMNFSHNEWFQDVRSEFWALAIPKGKSVWGFSFNSTNIGGIELRGEQPTPHPIAITESHDLAVGISFSRAYNRQIFYGATVKYVYEKLYIEQSWGIAVNVGLLYQTPIENLQLAVVTQNLGKMSKLWHQAPKLPYLVRFGVGYRLPSFLGTSSWLLSCDYLWNINDEDHLNMGLEYEVADWLAVRLGYQTGYEIKDVHLGVGMKFSRYRLDYGYVPLQMNFGSGHRLSLGVKF